MKDVVGRLVFLLPCAGGCVFSVCNLMQIKHKHIHCAYKTQARGKKLLRVEQGRSGIDRNSSKKVKTKNGFCSNRFVKVSIEKQRGLFVEIPHPVNFARPAR